MLVLFRTLVYATCFVGFLFLYLPSRFLLWSGIQQPESMGWTQIVGLISGGVGAAIGLTCIGVFIGMGKGTPAPFDPPRQLVVRGPYRYVRNPMYIGAVLVLTGVALFYHSFWIVAYGVAFLLASHLLVVFYEEPTLRRSFGAEYEAYCQHVRRWWPRVSR